MVHLWSEACGLQTMAQPTDVLTQNIHIVRTLNVCMTRNVVLVRTVSYCEEAVRFAETLLC